MQRVFLNPQIKKKCIAERHPVDNMLRDVYIYYGTSFIRVESFCFILSSWK
jgi:murein endopeptidase